MCMHAALVLHAMLSIPVLVPEIAMPRSSLQLDSTKSNPSFDNWKLARGLNVSEQHVTLEGLVTVLDHSTEYLNTRAAVLHNHLNYSGGRFFVFKTYGGIDSLCEVSSGQQVGLLKAIWGRSAFFRFCRCYASLTHGFIQLPSCRAIRRCQKVMCEPADCGCTLCPTALCGNSSVASVARGATGCFIRSW